MEEREKKRGTVRGRKGGLLDARVLPAREYNVVWRQGFALLVCW